MRRFSALFLCLLVPIVAFAFSPCTTYRVTYDGGSLFGLGSGDDAKVKIAEQEIQILDGKETVLARIPASSVTEISYGHEVTKRIITATGAAALTPRNADALSVLKSKKNSVGFTWMNGERKGGFAMHCDGGEYRGLLAQLEGVTGRKSLNSESESAKK